MLSDRRQMVLRALIEEYVACALPVGSRTLTENYSLGVSSATVRNELSALEHDGYIAQPHTSAGRIPTDFGYRAFVDNILRNEDIYGDESFNQIAQKIKSSATELDDLLTKTSETLSRLTECLSIVLAPNVLKLSLKQISLVSLSQRHILIVVVTEDGQVFNQRTELDYAVYAEDLAIIQNTLNDALVGKTIDAVEDGLKKGITKSFTDPLTRRIISEVLSCLRDSGFSHSRCLGLGAMLAMPEFSSSENIRPIIDMIEDDTFLLEIINDISFVESDPVVRIGKENSDEALSGVSVVASKYGRGNSSGVVAIVGPKRMDYSQVIKAVKMASSVLNDG